MHLVAFCKVFQTMCLDLHFETSQNPQKFTPINIIRCVCFRTVSLLFLLIILLTVCTDYIDEAFDGKKLWPTDPYEKAQGRLIVEDFGNKVS